LPVTDFPLPDIVAITQEAGALAMASWRAGQMADNVWEKSPGQYVCPADLAVNDFLRDALLRLIPQAGWLSEESRIATIGDKRELAWVIDPIDGTRDYVRGRAGWCVSVALVQDGSPLIGVLAAPARGELWVGEAPGGAQLNGAAIHASQRQSYAGARIPVDELPKHIDLVAVPKPNSIALRMAMVAADQADLVVATRWGSEWDIAAAHCIAALAGARVTDALGQEFRYNGTLGKALGVICTAPAIHAAAVARARPYLPKDGSDTD
jgi:myo-inositol-1(or 4)-monophosphatase